MSREIRFPIVVRRVLGSRDRLRCGLLRRSGLQDCFAGLSAFCFLGFLISKNSRLTPQITSRATDQQGGNKQIAGLAIFLIAKNRFQKTDLKLNTFALGCNLS